MSKAKTAAATQEAATTEPSSLPPMKMEVKRFEFLLESVTPIAHHQETFGNHAVVFRRKIRQADGSWAQTPFITGDSMRHQMREAIAYAYLDAAGLLNDSKLTEAALRLLFAGGMVTGRGDASTVKLDAYREMMDLVPSMSLLGGCANNRVIPGRLIVDDALLVCRESERLLPAWVIEQAGQLDTCRAHVEIDQRVRMDPTLDPGKRKLLSAGAGDEVQKRLMASEAAHDTDNAIARDETKSSMMPRTFETVARGSLFSWAVTATVYSDLDNDVLHATIAAFLSNARVGGKRGTGHGLMRAIAAKGIVVNRPSEQMQSLDSTALAPRIGELFRSHVASRKDRIRDFLGSVDS